MTLESSKTLGGVGALLVVIGFLGFFGTGYAGVLSLIGIILTLIALKGMADHYNEGSIFDNALYGLIIIVIGVVAAIAIAIVTIFTVINLDWADTAAIQAYFMDFSHITALLGSIIAALVVLFIFMIVSALFFRKSLTTLAMKSGEKMFETAGLLWLIGAVLTIILVGVILIWIAWILIAVGFFSIKTTTVQPPAAQPQPPPPPAQ